ncbi:CPBP family intramembrane glutamic endopeptidase [Marinifilum fragile]|uniref:CPBP family intramembrane glutamic endopeptidase n=1 Tax=Marinifilum fragile TaxID=570161 RepID=UPI0012F81BD2|nr:CPBP family intramembrane glutamic endopeptidase [Marinifilum fragile]
MSKTILSNKSLEILAIVLTVLAKFLFMDYLNWRFPFVLSATILWCAYIWYRKKNNKEILKYWGFRTDNFRSVLKVVLPFGLTAVIAFFTIGGIQGTINATWHIIPVLLFYPLWGSIQQFLLIGLVAGNLYDNPNRKLNKHIIVLFAATLFALVHYPAYWLIGGTFILAIFYGYVYLKEKNLYVLGIFHGWLGALFYYTVLDSDPFYEIFGNLLNL